MAKELEKGLFITFEGPEGSGKSTHSRRLCRKLSQEGYDCVHTLEPGSTALGEKVREILLKKDEVPLDAETELFLFEADRAQHVREVIRPALEKKKIVICDRFNTATFAYQGYGLGMDMDLIKRIDNAATGGISPDLTILLDVDVETGLTRAQAEHPADRMEKRSLGFHRKVREGYLHMAEAHPEKIKVIKVRDDKSQTYKLIREMIDGLIERHKRAE